MHELLFSDTNFVSLKRIRLSIGIRYKVPYNNHNSIFGIGAMATSLLNNTKQSAKVLALGLAIVIFSLSCYYLFFITENDYFSVFKLGDVNDGLSKTEQAFEALVPAESSNAYKSKPPSPSLKKYAETPVFDGDITAAYDSESEVDVSNELSGMKSSLHLASVQASKNISSGGRIVKGTRAIITSKNTSHSGGIVTANVSRGVGGGGLAGRVTTRVYSDSAQGGTGLGGSGSVGGSSLNDDIVDVGTIYSDLRQKKMLTKKNLVKRQKLKPKAKKIWKTEVAKTAIPAQSPLPSSFKPKTGYWKNTYLPGDPAIRLLESQLKSWPLKQSLALDNLAYQNWQPFDPPSQSAIALYLNSDNNVINGPTRLRLQVGIKGSLRQSGQRSNLNLTVLLDTHQLTSKKDQQIISELILNLARSKQPGDRFSLVTTSKTFPSLPWDKFKYGAIKLFLQQLFSEKANKHITDSFTLATQQLKNHEKNNSNLAENLMLLVSSSSRDYHRLQRRMQRNAVSGLPTSIVAIGNNMNLFEIDELARLGQGSRRILNDLSQVKSTVNKELYSSSRTVAKALRLKIKLANHVQLNDILGSHPLDEKRSQWVRDAENSIDQRISKQLGIKSDRGKDEEGIQIVIPKFLAGDSHVILLDVLVEKPGQIAEVTAKYKDLVFLKNGNNRLELSLNNKQKPLTALEYNVTKNHQAHKLANQLQIISQELQQKHYQLAFNKLQHLAQQIKSLQQLDYWKNDQQLMADQLMLEQYSSIAQPNQVQEHAQQLEKSIEYASFRRLSATPITPNN